MEHLDVVWWCPSCSEENLDNWEMTSYPACSRCENQWAWEEVITEEQIVELNKKLRELYNDL